MTMHSILTTIAQSIFDKKGFNILLLDVQGICTMTDYFVIAEGNVDRHVKALSLHIKHAMDDQGMHPFHVEGEREGDWVVIDYGDIVIHLFTPELREKYALEEMWKEGKIVDVKLNTKRIEE